jgi:hypothetical protein
MAQTIPDENGRPPIFITSRYVNTRLSNNVVRARQVCGGQRAAKVWNELAGMDEELRQMIENARVEAEFALLEIKIHGAAHAAEALRHMEALIIKLDEFLEKTHWSTGAARGRRH